MNWLKDLWRATTIGEKLLVVISLGFYVRTWMDIAQLCIVSCFVHMAANGIVTLILVWSMRRPRGSGF
jgi:hypothetical protein